MADDKLEIQTAIDTDGVDDGMLNIKNLVKKGMDVLNNSISGCISTVSGLGSALLNVAETAGKHLLSLGKSAISVGESFESSMSQVIATMGVTTETMTENGENIYEKLSEKAKEMGASTKFSASDAADALNYLALAGYDAEKACDALPQVLKLAQAGGMDLARTSDLVTDAMSALGIDATTENLQHFGDVLAKTASKSNTSVEQLGDALLVCGGQAKMSGLELNEMATTLGIFADNGIKGSEGGTALRNLLKNMYTPTSKAAQAMEQLGISASNAITGELRPVQEVLMDTMSAMESLSEADRMQAMSDIFDVQVLASASAALNNSSERFNELSAEIAKCDGAMQQMADTMNDNLEGDLAGLNSSLEGLGVEIYESLNQSLRDYVTLGTGYIRQLNEAFKSGGFEGLAQSVGSVLTSAISEISAKIPDVLNIAQNVIMSFLEGLSDNSKGIGTIFSDIVVTIVDSTIKFIPQLIATGAKIVVSFAQGLLTKLPEIKGKAVDLIRNFSTAIQEKFPEILEKAPEIIKGLADGFVKRKINLINAGFSLIKSFLQRISDYLPEIANSGTEILQNLINGVVSRISRLTPVAFEIITGLLNDLTSAINMILEFAPKILEMLINGVVSGISQLMPVAVEIITGLLNGLTIAINMILEFAPKILEMLINGIISAFPQLSELAVNILSTLISNLANSVTAILEFAPQILTSLIDGIIAVLPMLIDCAMAIVNALISGIIDNLEPILMACVEILMALVNGIAENITIVVDAAIEILNALISAIIENLPIIISVAIEIIMALLDGIVENLPILIDAAIEILNALVNCLTKNLSLLTEAAIRIVKQLFDGIIDNLPQILDAGISLITELTAGIVRAIPDIIEAVPQIISAIWDTIKETDWLSLGADILKGIANGLVDGLSAVWDSIKETGEQIWQGFKDFFGIHSPSRLMREEIGQWLLHGVAVGVEDTSDETAEDINRSLENLSERLEIPEIEQPEFSEIDVNPPEIRLPETESFKFDSPEIEPLEIPEQSEIELKSPEISISEPEPIQFDSPKISEIPDFEPSTDRIFAHQIEILREFAPVKDVPELDDERITTEIQSQLDEIMVTLNADNFIAQFEAILSGMGSVSVPQYSEVYGQIQNVPEKSENNRPEFPQNVQLSPKISVFIGDTEIKDFVISAIDEANVISGGVIV